MKIIYIAKLTEDNAQILKGILLNEENNGKIMVKILDTGFIYYEKVKNISPTRNGAIQILRNKNDNLVRCIKELLDKNES